MTSSLTTPAGTARLLVARAELTQQSNPKQAEKDADKALQLFGKKPALDDELSALRQRLRRGERIDTLPPALMASSRTD